MAVAIDSSVLVRYFTKDNEELFEKASKMITEAKPNSILLDRVIFAEFGYALRSVYELNKKYPYWRCLNISIIAGRSCPGLELFSGTRS